MPTSAGTKVTDYKHAVPEPVGVVTSDSLAAESLKQHGDFGKNNPHAAASKQPSHSTTTNNTDTSNARELPPAVNAEARDSQEGWSDYQQLQPGKGQGKEAGVGPTWNTQSGSGASSNYNPDAAAGGPVREVQGGYAGADQKALDPGVQMPKGKNLTELGDMEGKSKFGEIGTEDDPARLAELRFVERNAESGWDAANSKSSLKNTTGTAFDALNGQERA